MTVAPSAAATRAATAARPRDPDIIATIGSTPLVALDRLFPPARFQVYGKCERFNPGGSIKDRAARSMIEHALSTGALMPGISTVVESSSGNLGIALAQLCNFYRLDLICVVDPRTTAQNAAIMRAYGATVESVDRDPETGEYLPSRIRRVRELLSTVPDAYWPNQYGNEYNARAHQHTMREIHEALPQAPDYLFLAAGDHRHAARLRRVHRRRGPAHPGGGGGRGGQRDLRPARALGEAGTAAPSPGTARRWSRRCCVPVSRTAW